MVKTSKWTNIRALKTDVKKWNTFLEKYTLGSLPSYMINAINSAISKDKKRLK